MSSTRRSTRRITILLTLLSISLSTFGLIREDANSLKNLKATLIDGREIIFRRDVMAIDFLDHKIDLLELSNGDIIFSEDIESLDFVNGDMLGPILIMAAGGVDAGG